MARSPNRLPLPPVAFCQLHLPPASSGKPPCAAFSLVRLWLLCVLLIPTYRLGVPVCRTGHCQQCFPDNRAVDSTQHLCGCWTWASWGAGSRL